MQLSFVIIRNALQKCAAEAAAGQCCRNQSAVAPTETNLDYFHSNATLPRVPVGEFGKFHLLQENTGRKAFRCRWSKAGAPEEQVVVKVTEPSLLNVIKSRQPNDRLAHLSKEYSEDTEDIWGEIGVLQYLSKQSDVSEYIISYRGAFMEGEGNVWLVTEYAAGGELFHLVSSQHLRESIVCEYTWQLLHALEYLHRHSIAHRDVSLENILLKDGNVRLMDFGAACRSHNCNGTAMRYFRGVGKLFYRGPEAYVPEARTVRARAPSDAKEGKVSLVQALRDYLCEVRWDESVKPGQICSAEVFGYEATPVDIFASAVCLFMMAWGCPPWKAAVLGDQRFALAYKDSAHGVEVLLKDWKKQLLSPPAMSLLHEMMDWCPSTRPSAASCLDHAWFAKVRGHEERRTAVGGS
mmetsp:Transcript_15684/g.28536  ORF Transcript_15684/g.28536 Transcript_15684/m.28536 type:complete len:409 (-) Transcript_15684:78-1304(-)